MEKWETTDFGSFFQFKTLTMFPYDQSLIDISLLSDQEIDWINNYHKKVYARLSPLLNSEEKEWLAAKTTPLNS